MATAKMTHDIGSPEYQAAEWLTTINNAYREIDFAIEQSPNAEEFIERLKERVRREYELNREKMGWTERSRDIAMKSLEYVLRTRS
jgi:hypothetical protein